MERPETVARCGTDVSDSVRFTNFREDANLYDATVG